MLDLAIQITQGLEAAHRQGIVHRDIKPANIFVTTQGQAKILDFGLAKLAPVVTMGSTTKSLLDGVSEISAETAVTTHDLFLSRTGAVMGTAGYMSPEQVRGENLDARTDLFSFGLVLYEMATGKRAFTGDTWPALQEAILRRTPDPVRRVNPEVPAKLEAIIKKALEKNREGRYQAASDMRTDLETLQRQVLPKRLSLRSGLVAGGVILLLTVGVIFWFVRRQPSSQTLSDLKLQQLTINSPENLVTGGAISPDGKYLAYTDRKGMRIKPIGTDMAQSVPQPEELKNDKVNWEILSTAWFPDSKRFFANAHPASESPSAWSSQTSSIWIVSVLGGAPRRLRDNAVGWSVSPVVVSPVLLCVPRG